MRWTELPSPLKRDSHTSSAVKHRIGASQVRQAMEELIHHRAAGAAALR